MTATELLFTILRDPFHAGLAKHGSFEGFLVRDLRAEPTGPTCRPLTDLEVVRSQRRVGIRCEDNCAAPSA